MAQITKWALFWRALVLTLVFGQPAISQSAEETDAWTQAVETGTPEAFFKYLSIYPAGVFVDEAVDALEVLGAIGTRSVGNLNQQTSQQNQQPNQQPQTAQTQSTGQGIYP